MNVSFCMNEYKRVFKYLYVSDYSECEVYVRVSVSASAYVSNIQSSDYNL